MAAPRARRFCLLTTFYPPASFGGDAVFVRQLAHELVRRGHEVEVVYNADAYAALGGGRPPALAEPPGLTVHALSAGLGPVGPLLVHQSGRPLLLGRRLRAILARDFDVAHYHNVSLLGAPGLLAYGSGIKLFTTHEAWLVCPTHTLFRFNRAPCERPHCIACSLSYRRPPQLWRASRRLRRELRHVDAFIAPSRTAIELHRRRGLDLPFVEIPNFVPEEPAGLDEAAGEEGAARRRPFVLFAGRLERLKGAATLLPVFGRWPEVDLVIAGEGSEAERLRAAASPNVHLIGWQPAPALARLYRAAIAVVVPSLGWEIMPLVALEALRAGTPIVVPRRGSLLEVVERSSGGLVYDDTAGLERALRRLAGDRTLRDRLGAAGRAAVLAEWSADVHLARYLGLVERLEARRARLASGRGQRDAASHTGELG
jgi:glycosyltransferase involved in cell wall biosynthesis